VDKEKQDGEVIALSAATLIVYKQITGAEMPPNDAPETNAIMNDVALALSNVAPIYGARGDAERLKLLPALDLMHGAFQRGATILRTPKGIEYQKLFIRRDDLWLAIAVLKGIRANFKARP
jgi:hypothetical protein